MGSSGLYSGLQSARPKTRRRDRGLGVTVAVALLLTALIVGPFVYGAGLIYRFHRLTQALAVSFVEGEAAESITVDYGGETRPVSNSAASRLYTQIVDGFAGRPCRAADETSGALLRFGDGSRLSLCPSVRPSAQDEGRAVILCYTGADGAVYRYETARLCYEYMLGCLGLSV